MVVLYGIKGNKYKYKDGGFMSQNPYFFSGCQNLCHPNNKGLIPQIYLVCSFNSHRENLLSYYEIFYLTLVNKDLV